MSWRCSASADAEHAVHTELKPAFSASSPGPGSRSASCAIGSPLKTAGGDSALLNAAILNYETPSGERFEKKRKEKKEEAKERERDGRGRQCEEKPSVAANRAVLVVGTGLCVRVTLKTEEVLIVLQCELIIQSKETFPEVHTH